MPGRPGPIGPQGIKGAKGDKGDGETKVIVSIVFFSLSGDLLGTAGVSFYYSL